jgi:hypothetical protein
MDPRLKVVPLPRAFAARLQREIAANFIAGAMNPCRHLDAEPVQPQVVFCYDPARVCCLSCATYRALPDEEERTCDGCRRRVPVAGDLEPVVWQVSLVVMAAGLCARCLKAPIRPRVRPHGARSRHRGRSGKR